MKHIKMLVIGGAAAMLLVASCVVPGFELYKKATQLVELAHKLSNPLPTGPPHERLHWKAEEFFTDTGVIALCKAIEAKNLKEIDRLIESGVDVNATGRANMTPLLWAFPMGEDVFRHVLERGANPNILLTEPVSVGTIKSVTYAAAYAGGPLALLLHDVSMDNYLKLVLKHGGDPNLETSSGETPLFGAVRGAGNFQRRIQLLLDAGADIDHRDVQGNTAAMSATSLRYESLLILLRAGADCEIINEAGKDLVYLVAGRRIVPGGYKAKELLAVRNLLEKKGYDLAAAKRAHETHRSLHNLPADQRPWLNPKADGEQAAGGN